MDTFGIIMISVGFAIYGAYIGCCVYNVFDGCCNRIKECMTYCCKSNLPLDQDLITINQEIRLPLSMNLHETEINSI